MSTQQPVSNIAIVGAGLVGSAFAYALMAKGLVREMGLIDQDRARAEGEAMDLNHGLAFSSPMEITAGGYELCRDARIVVITAGASQKPGESRLDLVRKNAGIIKGITHDILAHNPSPILLVVTNPVDILTYVALKESGLPPAQVIGSGTVLDSARFRYLLSEHCGIDPRSIHAHVIGEHGDSEVALWSRVNIGGVPLAEYCPICGDSCMPQMQDEVFQKVKNAAYEIINRKGATNYAIGLSLTRIVEAIMRDQKSILTVSSLVDDAYSISGVCLSLPSIVGAGGVEKVIHAALAPKEEDALRSSARVLRETMASIGY